MKNTLKNWMKDKSINEYIIIIMLTIITFTLFLISWQLYNLNNKNDEYEYKAEKAFQNSLSSMSADNNFMHGQSKLAMTMQNVILIIEESKTEELKEKYKNLK